MHISKIIMEKKVRFIILYIACSFTTILHDTFLNNHIYKRVITYRIEYFKN